MTEVDPRLVQPPLPGRDLGADRHHALQELIGSLACGTPEEVLFQQALDSLQRLLELPSVAILLLAPDQRMRFRAWRGFSAHFTETAEGCCPWSVAAPKPQLVFAEDLQQDAAMTHCRADLVAEGIQSLAFSPILSRDHVLGELWLGNRLKRCFTPEEIRFTVAVANLLALATARSQQEQVLAEATPCPERLIDTANIIVVGLDRVGRVVCFNQTAELATGYSKAELLGKSWFETVVPQERFPAVRHFFNAFLESGVLAGEMETPLLTKAGEERWVSWRNSTVFEPGTQLTTLSFGSDVTEIHRSIESLRASEEMFSKIFHLSPDAIDLTRTADGVALDCNNSYLKLTGYSREEVIGHATLPDDLSVWGRTEDRDRHVAELRSRGEVIDMEVPLRRKDGSIYFALISSAMLEINGQPCNLTLTRDITERKKAEEALRVSEEKFSKTFLLSPDAITINRLQDGVYLDINQGFTELTGYTAEEVIGRSSLPGDLSIWVHQEDRDRVVAAIKTLGEVTGLEARFRQKNGAELIGLMSARLLELDGERCLLTITRDITDRRNAEEALRESSQRLQLALASSNLGIWDWNLLDDTEIWDDRMYEIYALERMATVPSYTTWAERVLHPEDAPHIKEATQSAIAGNQPYELKFRILRPDGSVRHIGSSGIVVRDAQGQAVRVIGVNRDRTEQVEAETERRHLQAEVHHAEKLESIGSLAGGVAHDMNNVLTAILITAEMLRDNYAEDAPLAKSLAIILHAGQRGRDLVKALTDFARKGLEETAPIDLNEVLRKEVELLRHTTLKKIQVILDLDENLPVILGATSALGSALMNLSVNAVDAMPEGGTLTFRSRSLHDGWIELAVADTGQGMTADILAKAMEPFFTTKPIGKGTGLGLSRVYGTVRAHGGTVEVHSKAGVGTTVILRLPKSPVLSPEATTPVGQSPETPEQTLRILLVDDESIILETIPALLEAMGHTVETASLGAEALRRLDCCQGFDLVILDHNMPGLTGVETLIQLRDKCPTLPVILSSGFMDIKTEAILADIPQVWVLKKPYNTRELQQALAEVHQLKAH